jgi:hypothetical protein
MTPKEKAEELFFKYRPIISEMQLKTNIMLMTDVIKLNKKMAIIVVDEILKLIDGFDLELTFNYYLEVKNELNKL